MRWLIVAGCTLLAGCSTGYHPFPAHRSEVVTASESQVVVKAGAFANPGPVAMEQCQRFRRAAELQQTNGDLYVFACR